VQDHVMGPAILPRSPFHSGFDRGPILQPLAGPSEPEPTALFQRKVKDGGALCARARATRTRGKSVVGPPTETTGTTWATLDSVARFTEDTKASPQGWSTKAHRAQFRAAAAAAGGGGGGGGDGDDGGGVAVVWRWCGGGVAVVWRW
jgi:hypothetical protein